jgi:hypothetical protein
VSGAWGGRVGTVLPNQENQPPVGLSRIQKCTGATSASPIVSTWAADAVEAMPFSPSDSPCALAPVGSSEIASWARKVIDAPYFEPIPSTLLSRVRDLLNQSNTDFSSDCGGVLSGWANLTAAQPPTKAKQVQGRQGVLPRRTSSSRPSQARASTGAGRWLRRWSTPPGPTLVWAHPGPWLRLRRWSTSPGPLPGWALLRRRLLSAPAGSLLGRVHFRSSVVTVPGLLSGFRACPRGLARGRPF